MNPDLELFLENVFHDVKPSSERIGRIVVEPNYDANCSESDGRVLREQIQELLRRESSREIADRNGTELQIPSDLDTLQRYIRRVTAYRDRLPGDWVEVTPPGNWI